MNRLKTSRTFYGLVVLVALLLSATGATAGTWYVSKAPLKKGTRDGKSWATADNVVQTAIGRAVSGDQVWVAGRLDNSYVYKENIHITRDKDGVLLYGGFAGTETALEQRNIASNQTILDGNHLGSVVYFDNCISPSNRLDGFTIRNGRGNELPGQPGGGYYGGGVLLYYSNATIENNTIAGNGDNVLGQLGGGIGAYGASGTIRNNTIKNNTISGANWGGGGIGHIGSGPKGFIIDNNLIQGNGTVPAIGGIGGGIFYSGGMVVVQNNRILDNFARAGGGILSWDSGMGGWGLVQGNLIAGNRTNGRDANFGTGVGGGMMGGGTYQFDNVINNTFVGNDSSCASGILVRAGNVSNNIVVYGKNDVGVRGYPVNVLDNNLVSGNSLKSNYSGCEMAWPILTSPFLVADPYFVDNVMGDYHLRYDSPAVGAGNPAWLDNTSTDHDKKPLLRGNVAEIGAYAFYAEVPVVAPTVVSTVPIAGATGVVTNQAITVTFSETVTDDRTPFGTFGNITVTGPLAVSINKSVSDKVLTITPLANLALNTIYTVRVPAGSIRDVSGNPLASDKVFTFTTARH